MVTLPIDLELILPHGQVRELEDSYLHYEPSDPYAATLDVIDPCTNTLKIWTFARDLLTDGLCRTAEPTFGDVKVWRCDPYQVHITLASPEGCAGLHAQADQIEKFLKLTYAVVPLEHEMDGVDMDRELASIFGEAA
ncbi:SsgA family sporulation/cell division regulator [Streptomyces sp. NPDC020707]|uniref:SsgA family sporulation/cell division regulator n=1 Tax=Streptomyces sp. NPDC020707 TaxID=3365084 RepID=UPI0037AB2EE2